MISISMRPRLTFIIGCTACGKSAVGFELARQVGGEIVSVDSMKVYRRMDIGTSKPPAESRRQVPYHLLDVVEPSVEFNVARYVALAEESIQKIESADRPILCVGGTALYIMALSRGLFEGPGEDPEFRQRLRDEAERQGTEVLYDRLQRVDPQAAGRIHRNDYRRIERALEVYELTGITITELQTQWREQSARYDCRFIGLRREKDEQNRRINSRVKRMMAQGLLDEVSRLLAEDQPLSKQARQAVGYAELISHLNGQCTLQEAVELIKIHTRRLAKSQRTWFRRFREATWLDVGEDETTAAVVQRVRSWYDATP